LDCTPGMDVHCFWGVLLLTLYDSSQTLKTDTHRSVGEVEGLQSGVGDEGGDHRLHCAAGMGAAAGRRIDWRSFGPKKMGPLPPDPFMAPADPHCLWI